MRLLGRLFGRGETGRSETAMVRSRYRSLLIPIAEVESACRLRISVASLLDLAQLAKREGRSLFVRDFDNGAQVYFMHDGLVIYQYAVGDVPQDWIRSAVASSEEPALSTREEVPVSALGVPVFKHEAFVSPQEASAAFPPVVEASPLASPYEEEQPPAPVTETVDEESDEAKFVEPIPEWLLAPSEYDEPENADEEVLQFSSGNGPAHESQAVPAGVGQPGAPADDPEATSSVRNDGSDVLKFVPAAEDPQAAEATSEASSNSFADLVWKRPAESETVAASAEEIAAAQHASLDAETYLEVARELPAAEPAAEDSREPESVSDTRKSAGNETSSAEAPTYEAQQGDSEGTSLAFEPFEDTAEEAMQPETEAVVTVSGAYSQSDEEPEIPNFESVEQEADAAADVQISVEDASSNQDVVLTAAIQPDAEAARPEAEGFEVKTFGPGEHGAADPPTVDEDVSRTQEDEPGGAREPSAVAEDGARQARSSRTRRRRQPLEKRLTSYAKKWLRNFLDY